MELVISSAEKNLGLCETQGQYEQQHAHPKEGKPQSRPILGAWPADRGGQLTCPPLLGGGEALPGQCPVGCCFSSSGVSTEKVYQDDHRLNHFPQRLTELGLSRLLKNARGHIVTAYSYLKGVTNKAAKRFLVILGNRTTHNGQKWLGMSKEDIIYLEDS